MYLCIYLCDDKYDQPTPGRPIVCVCAAESTLDLKYLCQSFADCSRTVDGAPKALPQEPLLIMLLPRAALD